MIKVWAEQKVDVLLLMLIYFYRKDVGLLGEKNDLPVTKVFPQKGGKFTLGPIKCYGNN